MHKKLFPIVILLLVVTSYVNAESFILNVGGVAINMTSPDGFHKVKSSNRTASKLSQMVTPPSNVLLATLLTKDDIQLSRSGELPMANEYMLVQTSRKILKHNIPISYFNKIKDSVIKQQYTAMNRNKDKIDDIVKGISSKFNNEYGEGHEVTLSDSVPLGIFLNKKNAIGFSTVMTNNLVSLGNSYNVIGSSTFILINNKILYIYIYRKVGNLINDKLWVEAKANEFVDLIIEDNN